MELRELHVLPRDTQGYIAIRITANSVALLVEFQHWEDGGDRIGLVKFVGVLAFQFYDEMRSSFYRRFGDAHTETLYEVINSPWRSQLLADESKFLDDVKSRHHFIVHFRDNGCLEVMAERFEVFQSTIGRLSDQRLEQA